MRKTDGSGGFAAGAGGGTGGFLAATTTFWGLGALFANRPDIAKPGVNERINGLRSLPDCRIVLWDD